MVSKSKNLYAKLKEKNISTINAGYRTFTLNITKDIKHQGDECFGLTDFDHGTISLEQDMEYETCRETLYHEITHIALELCGFGGDETTDLISGGMELKNEELTTLISRAFLMLMNLNPELFALLNENERSEP